MATSAPAKRRRLNFSEGEIHAMVNEITNRKRIIFGKLDSSRCTLQLKNHAWAEVLKEVNRFAVIPRTVVEIRRKFSDLRVNVKKKAAAEKHYADGTGGGPQIVTTYTAIEEAILQLFDPVAIHGNLEISQSEEASDEEREPTPGPSGAYSRGEFMLRPIQNIVDPITIVMNETKQEDIMMTVPIVQLEPETSATTNINESINECASYTTYEVETCSSRNIGTRKRLAANMEQRSRSNTPTATADDRSTVTGDRTDVLGSSPIPSMITRGTRPRTTSARKDDNQLGEMVLVQSQIRDSLIEIATQNSTNMESIASSLTTIASSVKTIAKPYE